MQPNKVYDEVIEFIASSSPQNVIAFRPSEEAKARVADLIFREKTEGLSEDERSELDHYLQIEHLMRLAKARAQYYLIAEADTFYGCEVDHIISLKHGGSSDPSNLAYACALCNRAKGSDIGSISTDGDF